MAVEPALIRNACLVGHRGSGKTALAEGMLGLASGRSGRASRVLDAAEDESERGMTLGMGVVQFQWKGRQINLLDTPGDGGFIADAFVAQRVADLAILVVHAQDPIQVVTERVWRRGEREDIPHVVAVNHLDRERTDFGAVVERLLALYEERLPLLPGAREAVERLAGRWPLGLASSSNRPVIDRVLELSGLGRHFRATVSSEEVRRGKPAPDVYLEAARRLGAEPGRCAAVEDSTSGILAAKRAGMRVISIPNRAFPPEEEALRAADAVVPSLKKLLPETVAGER